MTSNRGISQVAHDFYMIGFALGFLAGAAFVGTLWVLS